MKPSHTGFWVRLSIPREAFETERRVQGPQRNLSHTNVRDVKVFIHLCDILSEMSTDSGKFVSVDADHAKFINLRSVKQPEQCAWCRCTLCSLRRSNKVNATT
jgi:hypothetical protein